MSAPYFHKNSSLSEIPIGTPYPSMHSFAHDRDDMGASHVYVSGSMREEGLQQAVLSFGNTKNVTSPVSSLSPPHSSSSSDRHSGLDYLYESENSSCSHQTIDSHLYPPSAYSQSSHGNAQFYYRGSSSSQTSLQDPGAMHQARITEEQPCNFALSDKLRLLELETTLMGPDKDDARLHALADEVTASWEELLHNSVSSNVPSIHSLPMYERNQELQHTGALRNPLSYLQAILSEGSSTKTLLVLCASGIADGNLNGAEAAMQELRKVVSIYGSPVERLAAYMSEGLVAKLEASGSAIYKSLKCTQAPAVDVLSAMQKLYEICPYFKFAYMAANGAIAEAFRDEDRVHIFDFQIVQGTQWFSLIEALAKRPGGPPSVRITTVDDPSSHSSPIGGMTFVKQRLGKLAAFHGVPFEFHVVSSKLSDLEAQMIERRPGEALAVNFTLQLHHMPDESVCLTNPRDRLLRIAKSLQPKVLTLVEQEANTNTAPFLARFLEALDYYTAVFESIECKLPRDSKDRVNVEEQCLARDIVNVIACEGWERVERHELMAKWSARMMMAGFRPHPLSSYVNSTINDLLKTYSENYRMKEEEGALFLGWLNRDLVVASAWKVR